MSTEMSGTPLFYENTDENIDIMHVDEDSLVISRKISKY